MFLGIFELFLCFYSKFMEKIGLQAPGNYSASFRSNKISVLLCEGPKPNLFMISGFLSPREPLFMDLLIPNYCKNSKKITDIFLEILFL